MKKIVSLVLIAFLFVSTFHVTPTKAASNVTDEQMLIFSYLAYIDFKDYQVGKSIKLIKQNSNYTSSKKFKDLSAILGSTGTMNELGKVDNWILIKYINDNAGRTGFAVAVFENKSTNQVVVAYRGTDNGLDYPQDGSIYKTATNYQKAFAGLIAANAFINRPNSQIYFTGHSLGGLLAQYATFESKQRKLQNDLQIPDLTFLTKEQKARMAEFKAQVTSMKKSLAKLPYDKKTISLVTFNAPGLFSKNSEWQYYRYKYQFAKNYIVNGDPVGSIGYSLGNGSNGKIVFYRYESWAKLGASHGIVNFFKYHRILR